VLGLNRLTRGKRVRFLVCLTLALTLSVETAVIADDGAHEPPTQPSDQSPEGETTSTEEAPTSDGENAPPSDADQPSTEESPRPANETGDPTSAAATETAESSPTSDATKPESDQASVQPLSIATNQVQTPPADPPPPPPDLRVSQPLGISMLGQRYTDCRGVNEVIVGRFYSVTSNINAGGIVRLHLVDANGGSAVIGESGLNGGQARWDLIAHNAGEFSLKAEFLGSDQVFPTESSAVRVRFVPVPWTFLGDGGVRLNVPWFKQQFSLSCESGSLRSALAFHGVDTGGDLPILMRIGLDSRRRRRGRWGNPETHFVGHYNGRMMSRGYGVHSGPIARVANSFRPCNAASELRNASDAEIAGHINNGFPVEVWGANARRRARPTRWRAWDGGVVTAWNGEHTWLVVGFRGPVSNPSHFIIHDPSRTRRGGAFKELNLAQFHAFTKYFASPSTSRAVVIR
jgi:uncharacterized protein YvpB